MYSRFLHPYQYAFRSIFAPRRSNRRYSGPSTCDSQILWYPCLRSLRDRYAHSLVTGFQYKTRKLTFTQDAMPSWSPATLQGDFRLGRLNELV